MTENARSEMPTFITEHELATRQRRSVKTLQADRLKGGGVPFVKFGRAVRYRMSDVLAWEAASVRRSTSDVGGNVEVDNVA
ncbi:hypothetical protein ABIB57_004636 [Devosia sp. UYZn731]|uniref:helix-turn-helix transcriptional regulator n=1 Tax=Devosia sp. UYZn731 TaxID=3156345 RepID=UPI0033971165